MIKEIFKKKIASDLLYTIGSQLIMNGVIQLLIYPYINKKAGSEALGNIVFYMEIIYLCSIAIGQSLCNSRLATVKHFKTVNGDYNFLLKILTPIGAVGAVIVMAFYVHDIYELVLFGLLAVFTIIRYYISVEYRIHLNFKKYFLFFVILTGGYLLGTVLFAFTDKWYYIFLVGEIIVFAFMAINTTIFKGKIRSDNTELLAKQVLMLVVSYLLTELLNNLDRLILKTFVDANAVLLYYIVSMIGKTMLLFVGPLNNIILSYLANDKKTFTVKMLKKTLLLMAVVNVVFYILCIVGTPIYIKLFYPNMIHQINGLNFVVNAAQVLTFSATLIIVIILGTLGSKYHLFLQILYAVLLIPLSIIFARRYGVWGYAWASLVANALRLAEVYIVGRLKLPNE